MRVLRIPLLHVITVLLFTYLFSEICADVRKSIRLRYAHLPCCRYLNHLSPPVILNTEDWSHKFCVLLVRTCIWVEPRCWIFLGNHICIIYFNISINTGFLKPLFVSLHLLRLLFFQISQVCFYHNLHFCHSLIFL